jgi:aminoglycoside phosphotransferase (APT) family kinase protein
MSKNPVPPLTPEILHTLLDHIAPGSSLLTFNLLPGSFSNSTHIVEACRADGSDLKIVVRRYALFGDYDLGEKARREFKTFETLHRNGIPAPEPLYLDQTGAVLGTPGIVTRFVKGSLRMDMPADPLDWSRKLAVVLARIHSIPCAEDEQDFLLNGNSEATWFLKSNSPPQFMKDYPGGAQLWQTIRDAFPSIRAVLPVFLHIDYWSGNILWHENEISAVLDWEEASRGDPAVDVGHARMNIALMGLPQAADEFLRVYESEAGRKLENLGFWELAASARPMVDPENWIVTETGGLDAGTFRKFIEDAKRRM